MNSVVPECLFSQVTLPSHCTSQYFSFSASWHWWQPHKTFYVRAVSISAGWYIIESFFFIFKGAGHNSLNLSLVPESMTDSHTLLLALYFSHTCPQWLCYIIQAKKWGEGSIETESTVKRQFWEETCPLVHKAVQHTEIEVCHWQIKVCLCDFFVMVWQL